MLEDGEYKLDFRIEIHDEAKASTLSLFEVRLV